MGLSHHRTNHSVPRIKLYREYKKDRGGITKIWWVVDGTQTIVNTIYALPSPACYYLLKLLPLHSRVRDVSGICLQLPKYIKPRLSSV